MKRRSEPDCCLTPIGIAPNKALVGAGLGDARYHFYLEHDDSSSPDFSDLCSGFGFVTTAWRS
jgi:hypothetical protein